MPISLPEVQSNCKLDFDKVLWNGLYVKYILIGTNRFIIP